MRRWENTKPARADRGGRIGAGAGTARPPVSGRVVRFSHIIAHQHLAILRRRRTEPRSRRAVAPTKDLLPARSTSAGRGEATPVVCRQMKAPNGACGRRVGAYRFWSGGFIRSGRQGTNAGSQRGGDDGRRTSGCFSAFGEAPSPRPSPPLSREKGRPQCERGVRHRTPAPAQVRASRQYREAFSCCCGEFTRSMPSGHPSPPPGIDPFTACR
jgi:hypothetical protein